MIDISPNKLSDILQNDPQSITLVDVREKDEHDFFNIGGVCIPFYEIVGQAHSFFGEKPVVFYCSKGIRSAIAIQRLDQKFPNHEFYNLSGGLDAWKKLFF